MKERVETTKNLFNDMCSLSLKAISLGLITNLTSAQYVTMKPMFPQVQKLAWCTSILTLILTLPKISRLEQASISALNTWSGFQKLKHKVLIPFIRLGFAMLTSYAVTENSFSITYINEMVIPCAFWRPLRKYRKSLFWFSKLSCPKFSRKIIFLPIELNENFYNSREL